MSNSKRNCCVVRYSHIEKIRLKIRLGLVASIVKLNDKSQFKEERMNDNVRNHDKKGNPDISSGSSICHRVSAVSCTDPPGDVRQPKRV